MLLTTCGFCVLSGLWHRPGLPSGQQSGRGCCEFTPPTHIHTLVRLPAQLAARWAPANLGGLSLGLIYWAWGPWHTPLPHAALKERHIAAASRGDSVSFSWLPVKAGPMMVAQGDIFVRATSSLSNIQICRTFFSQIMTLPLPVFLGLTYQRSWFCRRRASMAATPPPSPPHILLSLSNELKHAHPPAPRWQYTSFNRGIGAFRFTGELHISPSGSLYWPKHPSVNLLSHHCHVYFSLPDC